MSRHEIFFPCALAPNRERADDMAGALERAGIEARVERPDARTHGLADGTWQVSVPGTQASRARAILSASG